MQKNITSIDLAHVTGLMSGTSLDGLDIACCSFREGKGSYDWTIEKAVTLSYPPYWKAKLERMQFMEGRELISAHVEYGHYLGGAVREFLNKYDLNTELISSHGHTIFHRPDLGYTFQAGDGAALASVSGLPVICDLRSGDVARKGQGAPLVPIGDRMLFGQYDACLNIGGFANISYEKDGDRLAFDICPVNKVLNTLAGLAGMDYDDRGQIAARGVLIPGLAEDLDSLAYYHSAPPKSLGEEWLRDNILPLTEPYHDRLPDLLHTLCVHMAGQIAGAIRKAGARNVLATGGGVYNHFLLREINRKLDIELSLPDDEVIEYKEALVFAFLGLLRWQGKHNVLASVTGASSGHSGGAVYLP
ncbi:MAG: anhydro-N-acetylmuramic acid kinase [Bacteroidales bacterium]|nr:anhydro-N-acetylmuramic acid kinase [Bacteroidales bacterium]